MELARNYGQHQAVLAGFSQARGRYLVTLDADLQNPPEEIPRILAELRAGHDAVGSVRVRPSRRCSCRQRALPPCKQSSRWTTMPGLWR